MTLKSRAEEVRDESVAEANTANRVGQLMVDMIDKEESDKAEVEAKIKAVKICSAFNIPSSHHYSMAVVSSETVLVLDAKNITTDETYIVESNDTLRFFVPKIYDVGGIAGDYSQTYKDNFVVIKFTDALSNIIYGNLYKKANRSGRTKVRVKDLYGKQFDVNVGLNGTNYNPMVIGELIAEEIQTPAYDDTTPIELDDTTTTYTIVGDEANNKTATSSESGGEIILGDISTVATTKSILITILADSFPIIIDGSSYVENSVVAISTTDGGTTWTVSDLTETLNNTVIGNDIECKYYYDSSNSIVDTEGLYTIELNETLPVALAVNDLVIVEDNQYLVSSLIDTTTFTATLIQSLDNVLRFFESSTENYYYAQLDNGAKLWVNLLGEFVFDEKILELNNITTPTDANADGGGITLKGTTDKTILWDNATNEWDFNQGINVQGQTSTIQTNESINIGNLNGDINIIGSQGIGTHNDINISTSDIIKLQSATLNIPSMSAATTETEMLYIDSTGNVAKGTSIKAYSDIYNHDNTTAQSIPTGTTYTLLTQWGQNGFSKNATPDYTTGKITVTYEGYYLVKFTHSFSSGTNNVIWKSAAFINGVEQDQCHFVRKTATGDTGNASFEGIVYMTAGQYVDARIVHDNGGSVDLTSKFMNLTIHKID